IFSSSSLDYMSESYSIHLILVETSSSRKLPAVSRPNFAKELAEQRLATHPRTERAKSAVPRAWIQIFVHRTLLLLHCPCSLFVGPVPAPCARPCAAWHGDSV
ncbi:hypothetical protein HAX54_048260, partial [Datura stramonium]|nr:hypothetical protein [Datura stramonium]